MSDTSNEEFDTVLAGLEPPPPPRELRARVLAAARHVAFEEPEPDLWTRVWNSRGLRLAWAAAVASLVAGHLLVGPGNGVTSKPRPELMASIASEGHLLEIDQLARIAGEVRPLLGDPSLDESLIFELKGNPS